MSYCCVSQRIPNTIDIMYMTAMIQNNRYTLYLLNVYERMVLQTVKNKRLELKKRRDECYV